MDGNTDLAGGERKFYPAHVINLFKKILKHIFSIVLTLTIIKLFY